MLWLRKARLTILGGGGITINPGNDTEGQLRIAFSVARNLSSSANEGRVTITNLSRAHRGALGREFTDVRLEAGYVGEGSDGVGVILEGQIREVRSDRDGPDIHTEISVGDGDRALRRGGVSDSFPAETPVEDVIRKAADGLTQHGVRIGEIKLPEGLGNLSRPYAMWGAARRELDRLGREYRFYWSIQNGTLEIVPGDNWLEGVQSFDADTGLVGVPTVTDNGVEATVLLSPGLRPGRQVRIVSDLAEIGAEDGLCRISSLTHAGDNYDGDFTTKITGEAVRGGRVDEGGE